MAATPGPAADWKSIMPPSALVFDFGDPAKSGLRNVGIGWQYAQPKGGYGFLSFNGLCQGGGTWPDALTGTYVGSYSGHSLNFRADVSNGEYLVWLCAGKIIRPDLPSRHFLLKLNDQVLCDATPSDEIFNSDQYLHRFIWERFSRRPHAVWNRFVDKMYPSSVHRVTVTNGVLALTAANYFISALIAVPAQEEAAFEEMVANIRKQRIEEFERTYPAPDQRRPVKLEGDGDALVFVPAEDSGVNPWTQPTAADRRRNRLQAAAARGERVIMQIAVTPFAELGESELVLADLKGPGTIPAGSIHGYNLCYSWQGGGFDDRMLPSLKIDMEEGLSQCFWLVLRVPAEAKAGLYKATFTFKPGKGEPVPIPVEFEVYPFELDPLVPASFGMWGIGYDIPAFIKGDARLKLLTERFTKLREEIGFTAVEVESPGFGKIDRNAGTAEFAVDKITYQAAKAAGLARCPGQELLMANLFAGAGRDLRGKIGKNIGDPEFKKLLVDALRRYSQFVKGMGLPVAVNVVDEPRENPNAWNETLGATLAYADACREAGGLTVAVNPMADVNGGKNYTVLVDHCDIISTHPWAQSQQMIQTTLAKQKTLWFFNAGVDRYSWGFHAWAAKCTGRWEWHICWMRGTHEHAGYPGIEWHNQWITPCDLSQANIQSAPFPDPRFGGGFIFKGNIMVTGEGITDYTYLYTLSQALKKSYSGKKEKTAEEARKFLKALETAIPRYPNIAGLAPGSDGSAVGMGINDAAANHVTAWRKKIAGYLKELNKQWSVNDNQTTPNFLPGGDRN
jgi:hypothetical protein